MTIQDELENEGISTKRVKVSDDRQGLWLLGEVGGEVGGHLGVIREINGEISIIFRPEARDPYVWLAADCVLKGTNQIGILVHFSDYLGLTNPETRFFSDAYQVDKTNIGEAWPQADVLDELRQQVIISRDKSAAELDTEADSIRPGHYADGEHDLLYYLKNIIGEDGVRDFIIGNVIKYVYRYRDKNGIEDLKKAQEYLRRLIEKESNGEDN